jgi:hypothetical protein
LHRHPLGYAVIFFIGGRMKTKDQVVNALAKLDRQYFDKTKFPAMNYEDGVKETLEWILEVVPDDEYEYAPS